jgi:hypothetical protein
MISMDEDIEEKDFCELMDNINVHSLDKTQLPSLQKRTKSNSLYNKHNLEEEKIAEDRFSNPQKVQ